MQNYQFNAHGVELGQQYGSTAIVPDGTPPPAYDRDPELYYHHTTRPGARLPHAWLQKDSRRLSTLDLVGHSRFTVLAGICGQAWRDSAENVGAEFGIEIAGRLLGPGCDYADILGDWEQAKEISDRGCLIERPDHHIAWRSDELPANPANPADALRRVCVQVLARGA